MTARRIDANNIIFFRARFTVGAVFVFALVLMWRLFDLQFLSAGEMKALASRQQSTVRVIPAKRGDIFLTDLKTGEKYPVATSRVFNHVFVVPDKIRNIEEAVGKLKPVVEKYGLDEETLRYRLSKKNDIYEPIAHKVEDAGLEEFKNLGIEGIEFEDETWRYYPEGEILGHITGFVGVKDESRIGQYGIEGYFEEELKGKDGYIEGKRDISGRLIQTAEYEKSDPEPGVNITLTIDRTLQSYIYYKLKEMVEAQQAESGTVIVADPETGAILAMCSFPSFDPNSYSNVEDIGVYLNPSVSSVYEPGSIFKSITMAGALDSGAVESKTTYFDEGFVKIGNYTIKNSDGQSHGEVDMVTVLNESLNTGAIFVQESLGVGKFNEYLKSFGFGQKTGIDIGQEVSGNISSLEKDGKIYGATASFGQGIAVTPIQILMSYAAIANGGKLMKPYIVREKEKDGKIIYKAEPTVVRETISVQSSSILSGMLVSVVRVGHAKYAGVPGYYIAGKTGTAQVADSSGGYGNQTIHSFVGFGPVDNPVFVMLVKIDKPKNARFAASTSAPLFGNIAKFILQYYEVPPDEK